MAALLSTVAPAPRWRRSRGTA